jgi:uncharacterized protein with PIN domain
MSATSARAYQEAAARLRRRHDEEFHEILNEVYAEWGMEIKKRRSRQQVAKDQIEAARRILDKIN